MSYQRFVEAVLRGEPYFGPVLRALQGLPDRHKYFLPALRVAAQSASGPLAILEIGSWAGASTVSWASALKELALPGRIVCVDPWEPYFDLTKDRAHVYGEMNRAAETGLIYKLFQHNVAASGFAGIIEARPGPSRSVVPGLPSDSFHLVYVDGSHLFEDVLFDIREAKRLIRDGGIVCGDDLEIQASRLTAEELEQGLRTGEDFVWSTTAGKQYHPGVTAAIDREFGAVSCHDGFWLAERSKDQWISVTLDLDHSEIPNHLAQAISQVQAETASYLLVSHGARYFAVAKGSLPFSLLEQLFGSNDIPPLILTGHSLDEVRRKAEQQEASTPASVESAIAVGQCLVPRLLGTYCEFNIVQYGQRTYGLRQSLGEIDVTVGDDALLAAYSVDDVIVGESSAFVRARIDYVHITREIRTVATAVRTLADDISLLRYGAAGGMTGLGTYRDFSLTAAHNRVYGIRSSVGPVDLTLGEDALLARLDPGDLVIAASADAVRARIDAIESQWSSRMELSAIRSEMQESTRSLQAIRSAAEQRQDAFSGKLERIKSDIYRTVQELSERIAAAHLEEWGPQLAQVRAETTAQAKDLEERLQKQQQANLEALDRLRASVSSQVQQVEAAAAAQLAQLSLTVEEMRRAAANLSTDVRIFGQQVTEVQYGPGGRRAPHLLESYRGFRLFRYEAEVYAVRQDLSEVAEPTELILNGQIEARYDGENIIIARSQDGARARIDALHAETAARELALKLELIWGKSLDLEFLKMSDSHNVASLEKHGVATSQSVSPTPVAPYEVQKARYNMQQGVSQKRITVIYNYFKKESTLFQSLEALKNQTWKHCRPDDIEIVLVDDGSEGEDVVDRLPSDVRYLWQRKNGYGICRAKNIGARLASGEYIVFLDPDIKACSEYLDAMLEGFQYYGDRVVQCGYIWDYHFAGCPDPRVEFGVWERPNRPTRRFYQVAGGNLAMSRALYYETGGFDEELIYGGVEDLLFGYQISKLPETSILFNRRMESWHIPHPPGGAHIDPGRSWEVVKRKWPEFYEEYIVRGLR